MLQISKKLWKAEEIELLRKQYGVIPINDLALLFNTTYQKVVDKAHKIGLNSKLTSGELWSKEEDQVLEKHFEYAPKRQLEKLFPNRTWYAILQRGLKTLNLKRLSQDRYDVNYEFFSKWTPESAYVFGFIAADGHIRSGKMNALQVEIQKQDIDILDNIKSIMKYEGPILLTKRNTVKLQINNKKIVEDLIAKGIPADDKTHLIKYPASLPRRLSRHFIRGVFDGDGSIYKHGKYFRIQLLGTYDLLAGIKKQIPLDLTANNITYRGNNGGADIYVFAVAGINAVIIADWMYQGTELYSQRKYDTREKLSHD